MATGSTGGVDRTRRGLAELAELLKSGAITQAEFDALKAKLPERT
jgi:hypothetical protein